MQNTKFETIQNETLTHVTGGASGGAGWLGMLSGGRTSVGSLMGGGGFGLNGKGGGLAETVGGWGRRMLGGGSGPGVVEGK